MNNKLKYPIKLENGQVLESIEEEILFFQEREKKISEILYYGGSTSILEEKLSSGECCYGLEII